VSGVSANEAKLAIWGTEDFWPVVTPRRVKMSQKSSAPPTRVPAEKLVRDIRRATRMHHSAEERIRYVMEGLGWEKVIEDIEKRGPESFAFLVATAAPVASKIETLPGPKDLKLPCIRKSFATDLDGAATERSRVFSPNSPIFSKA
jgi:hypothetical protein